MLCRKQEMQPDTLSRKIYIHYKVEILTVSPQNSDTSS